LLDAGSFKVGKDYYIYLCPTADGADIVISANSTFPDGYAAQTSRKIGGFHYGHIRKVSADGKWIPIDSTNVEFGSNGLIWQRNVTAGIVPIAIQEELRERTYRVGEYRPFIIMEPKRRQIVALPFKDRVVQHAVHNIIEPTLDKRMIYDSYACRNDKGTHAAAKRLSYFLGKPDNIYYLKIDIKSFFASINISILKTLIRRYIQDEGILWLLETVFDSSPFSGLPIGNLLSQLFANLYLHELDHRKSLYL
jgi:hypothetical protein